MIFWIAVSGLAGALLRFQLDQLLTSRWGTNFPWATLVINLIGCMKIGVFFAIGQAYPEYIEVVKVIITGLLGAFTTYSTFTLQWVLMLKRKRLTKATLYIGVSVLLGAAFTGVGWMLTLLIL